MVNSGCPNTGSDLAVKWAQSKIEECLGHPACHISPDACLPDRVLDISSINADDPTDPRGAVRLHESKNQEDYYAALSHMWGGHQPLRLLKGSIEKFREGIIWSSLPKTFQQAIQFTRKLGMNYIWIDSLCIIQDDAADWREQSSKMATIYENSSITLAAATAVNSLQGCFQSPDPFLTGFVSNGTDKVYANDHEALIELLPRNKDETLIFVRKGPTHRYPSRLETNQLPLLSRGWVYQERLLSPRVLFFGDIDVMWECNERMSCYCDTWKHSGSRNVRSHPVKSQHALSLQLGNPDAQKLQANGLANRWCRIVEEYSALDLTFMRDQLPAMAGIAKQFSRYMGEHIYASGVWSAFLIENLCWAVKDYPPPRRRPEAAAATSPSWSWMTPIARVTFPSGWFSDGALACASLVGTRLEHKGIDPFMDVTHGSITLKGYLLEARVREIATTATYAPIKHGISLVNQGSWQQPIHLDAGIEAYTWNPIMPLWLQKLGTAENPNPDLYMPLAADGNIDEEQPILLYNDKVLSIKQIPQRFWIFAIGCYADDGGRTDVFLLLECVEEVGQVYKRVGLGTCSTYDSIFKDLSENEKVEITLI